MSSGPEHLEPGLDADEREALTRAGERMAQERPLPRLAFAAGLRRRLRRLELERAERLRLAAAGYVGAGALLLAVAAAGLLGVGPFAA